MMKNHMDRCATDFVTPGDLLITPQGAHYRVGSDERLIRLTPEEVASINRLADCVGAFRASTIFALDYREREPIMPSVRPGVSDPLLERRVILPEEIDKDR